MCAEWWGIGGRSGLGSDMDGGFTSAALPGWIDHPRDLEKLANGLRKRGWSDEDVAGFAWGNWARFWKLGEDGRSRDR